MHEGGRQPSLRVAASKDGSQVPDEPARPAFLAGAGERVAAAGFRRPGDPEALRRARSDGVVHPRAGCMRYCPQARCVMHLHPTYTTALWPGWKTARCIRSTRTPCAFLAGSPPIPIYGGMALANEEGDRLAGMMGTKPVLMMGNHGVTGRPDRRSPPAFDEMVYFERAGADLDDLPIPPARSSASRSDAVAQVTAQAVAGLSAPRRRSPGRSQGDPRPRSAGLSRLSACSRKIWYIALCDRLRDNANFAKCAYETISVARDFYDGATAHKVQTAWMEVGVLTAQQRLVA